ncbi:uncharacterized protein FOMMEDRAFT_164946 [Fomitiporia mediterranea MF3/22]|uniref:uncharacterized protein n=1 Tax=Fomitiporia mediterranea (strain MF3/22) TaxID=694068 RepID=UPI0004408326|nr:uncharacterized protein FOMMEDRAFT_164946 [Fomitiporia mediterranea MF3/22]EJD08284.1 hypothetical protein FOMMEDRAFT_164946 [Fomitiporia mediterranea MF3/22]
MAGAIITPPDATVGLDACCSCCNSTHQCGGLAFTIPSIRSRNPRTTLLGGALHELIAYVNFWTTLTLALRFLTKLHLMLDTYRCIRILPLPAELLLYIFKLATDNVIRDIDRFVDLPPFESIDSQAKDEQCDLALKTKWSITLTCSAFRRLCTDFLYEDIRVRHGSAGLADVLERSEMLAPGAGVGRTVKRAVLFPLEPEDDSAPCDRISKHTRRILACCPNIRAVFRPKVPLSGQCSSGDADSDDTVNVPLEFPSLQRVDWSSCPSDDPPTLSQLPCSIWSSESLKTLSVGVKEWSRFTGMQGTEVTNIFSGIHTLRVRSLDAFGTPGQRLFSLELPSLHRLVLEQPDSMYALFSVVQYGDQITTLEFGLHKGFLEHDYIMVLLVYCPNTTDLYFPIFTTSVTRRNSRGMSFTHSIKRIVLHAAVEEGSEVDEEQKWDHLTSQFESICGEHSRFMKLERITLYGEELG